MMKKEPTMKVCLTCAWKGMKCTKINGTNPYIKIKCDLCGKNKTCYSVRSCNLQ